MNIYKYGITYAYAPYNVPRPWATDMMCLCVFYRRAVKLAKMTRKENVDWNDSVAWECVGSFAKIGNLYPNPVTFVQRRSVFHFEFQTRLNHAKRVYGTLNHSEAEEKLCEWCVCVCPIQIGNRIIKMVSHISCGPGRNGRNQMEKKLLHFRFKMNSILMKRIEHWTHGVPIEFA